MRIRDFSKSLTILKFTLALGRELWYIIPRVRGLSAAGSATLLRLRSWVWNLVAPLHDFSAGFLAFFIWRDGQVVRQRPAAFIPGLNWVRLRDGQPRFEGFLVAHNRACLGLL